MCRTIQPSWASRQGSSCQAASRGDFHGGSANLRLNPTAVMRMGMEANRKCSRTKKKNRKRFPLKTRTKGSTLDFAWTDEQAAFRKEVIRFARTELNDDLERRDREEEFPFTLWKKCAEFGIQGLPVPPEYGGGGADTLTTVCAL